MATQLNVAVSSEAHEQLREFAAENGVSMTVFLEALCLRLDPQHMPRWLGEVVREARRIEADRRRRSKP